MNNRQVDLLNRLIQENEPVTGKVLAQQYLVSTKTIYNDISVINQYLVSVRPMHEKYIKPTKQYADIIVPDGGYNDIAVDILITKIKSLLAK